MFQGFNLTLNNEFSDGLVDFEELYNLGENSFETTKKSVRKILKNSFVFNSDNSIDGTELQESWFPEVKSDIFISHSHKDEKLAIALSGWIKNNFGLNTFIDSSVWGYSDKLLKMLDDDYCYNSVSGTYSYEKRNVTTSHVHIMLSTALYNMMDKSKCVFFLNTPNSTSKIDVRDVTKSPWIYAELEMTRIIRLKRNQCRTYDGIEKRSFNEFIQVTYNTDLSHLLQVDIDILNKWKNICCNYSDKSTILLNSRIVEHPKPLEVLLELAISEKSRLI